MFTRILLFLFSLRLAASASVTNDLPRFEEVYKLLRENMGVSASELDQAAVKGLIHQLQPQALLVGDAAAAASANAAGLAKTRVYDGAFVYFQISGVGNELSDKLMAAYRDIAATNKTKLKG